MSDGLPQARLDAMAAEYASEILRLTDELEAMRAERDGLLADLEEFRDTISDIGAAIALGIRAGQLRIVKP